MRRIEGRSYPNLDMGLFWVGYWAESRVVLATDGWIFHIVSFQRAYTWAAGTFTGILGHYGVLCLLVWKGFWDGWLWDSG